MTSLRSDGHRWSHGTLYGYRFHGCRCPDCRAAESANRAGRRYHLREYMRDYRARNREKLRARNRDWMRRYRAALKVAA